MATRTTSMKKEKAKQGEARACTKTCKSSAAATTTTAKSVDHEFSLMAPEAAEVYLVGDFNNWESGKDKMRKLKNGLHKKNLKLNPGSYEYRFIVDGHWLTDPANEQRCRNVYGEDNSVLKIS